MSEVTQVEVQEQYEIAQEVGVEQSLQPITDQLAQIIYDKVISLQKREFGRIWTRDIDDIVMKYIMYIHKEADEALDEVNFKFHKTKHPIDMEKLRLEICDLLIYVFALSGVVFESLDDFLQAVKQKQDYNETRQDWK